jgi:ssDNA thymidine ADP-ribosyltransferase, DarT
MTLEELISKIESSKQHSFLYHFTDERNFPLIKKHGLLTKNEMRRKGIWPEAPSGNQWSWDADDHKGISDYVSLCMTKNHPMCHVATKEERVVTPRYLCIKPDILLTEGVMFAGDIANKSTVTLRPIREAVEHIDIEVLYSRTDWKNPEVQSRLRVAEKYEILVPGIISLSMIPRVY